MQWEQEFKESLDWRRVWKGVSHSWNDPLVRDFDWRNIHRVLPVNSRLHRWNSRLPISCAGCGERVESLKHTLVYCPKVKDMWMFILRMCNKIDQMIVGLSEKNIFLGSFPQNSTSDIIRYLISVDKFAAWKERVSSVF